MNFDAIDGHATITPLLERVFRVSADSPSIDGKFNSNSGRVYPRFKRDIFHPLMPRTTLAIAYSQNRGHHTGSGEELNLKRLRL
jgi:hypothetical protein